MYTQSTCIKGIYYCTFFLWILVSTNYSNFISDISLYVKFLVFREKNKGITSRMTHPVRCTLEE